MKVRKEFIDDIAIFFVSGKIMNPEETPECYENVKDIIAKNIKKVIIDLSEVIWLNSQGVGLLVTCFTSVRNAVGDFKISGGNEKVMQVLGITQILTLIPHYESLDLAIQSFNEQ